MTQPQPCALGRAGRLTRFVGELLEMRRWRKAGALREISIRPMSGVRQTRSFGDVESMSALAHFADSSRTLPLTDFVRGSRNGDICLLRERELAAIEHGRRR
jgi:hypothetical protein